MTMIGSPMWFLLSGARAASAHSRRALNRSNRLPSLLAAPSSALNVHPRQAETDLPLPLSD